jgi:hypothetical protein
MLESSTRLSNDLRDIQSQFDGLKKTLQDIRVRFAQESDAAIKAFDEQLSVLKRNTVGQEREFRHQIRIAKDYTEVLRRHANAQASKIESLSQQTQPRKLKPQSIPKKSKPAPYEPPCFFRSLEPAGKLNCGCQGAPVAYECSSPDVGGFVTLHASSLRDQILRKPNGEQFDMGTTKLKPCSLCKYRQEAKDGTPEVSADVLNARLVICEACLLRPDCPTYPNGARRPEASCPDGRWSSEGA